MIDTKLRCMYCGKFIAYQEIDDKKAVSTVEVKHRDSLHGPIEYEDILDYHIACKLKDEGEPK